MKLALYVHDKGGSTSASEHCKPLFADYEVIGIDYKGDTTLNSLYLGAVNIGFIPKHRWNF